MDVVGESLLELVFHLRARLAAGESTIVLRVLDPDLGGARYPGEPIEHAGRRYMHRPFRVWLDLAERLGLRLATPRALGEGLIELRFEALDRSASWHLVEPEDPREKYGTSSGYARISKLEDPDLLLDLADALDRIALPPSPRILDLGINTGDEFELLGALRPELRTSASFVGVDHSDSALALARERFAAPNYRFVRADINALAELELGVFDLVVSLATLQSPGIDDRALLRHLVQDRLTPKGALLLGIPNCRYVDGERIHGARTRNHAQADLALVIRDVAFFKRYLQQHRKRVFVTGKSYVLVTAIAASDSSRE
ncbi:class I SAM-dependent methyltransferase [Nannocystaceae bacterium ST9]